MEKDFEKFCSRVKKERVGVPSRAKYPDWVVDAGPRAESEGLPAVVNVTRVTVGAQQDAPRVLARLVCGEISLEFFDEGALAQSLSGVLP